MEVLDKHYKEIVNDIFDAFKIARKPSHRASWTSKLYYRKTFYFYNIAGWEYEGHQKIELLMPTTVRDNLVDITIVKKGK